LLEGCPIVRLIPQRLLIAAGPFGPDLPASVVLAAITRGLQAGGAAEPDPCPLPRPAEAALPAKDAQPSPDADEVRALLDALHFDTRMRSARAVVVCTRRLEERALAGSATFEIATRARQGGVPAYAVTGENRLGPFDTRILDLQVVLVAGSAGALAAAGRKLARLIQANAYPANANQAL
jgi:hypothetical protein